MKDPAGNAEHVRVGRLLVEVSANRWCARYPVAGVSPFTVEPDILPDAIKGQDIVIGVDQRFDREFRVQGQDPVLLRRIWTADACRALFALRAPRVEGTLEEIRVRAQPSRDAPAPRERGLELLAALDRGDPLGLDLLEGWGGGVFTAPGGSFHKLIPPVMRVPGALEILAGPIYIGGAAVTGLKAPGRADPVILGRDLRNMRAAELGVPAGLHERVGAARFEQRGDHLHLLWYQIVRRAAVLDAGIETMRALLRGPRFGPYR